MSYLRQKFIVSYGTAYQNVVFGFNFVKGLARSYAESAVQIELENLFWKWTLHETKILLKCLKMIVFGWLWTHPYHTLDVLTTLIILQYLLIEKNIILTKTHRTSGKYIHPSNHLTLCSMEKFPVLRHWQVCKFTV